MMIPAMAIAKGTKSKAHHTNTIIQLLSYKYYHTNTTANTIQTPYKHHHTNTTAKNTEH